MPLLVTFGTLRSQDEVQEFETQYCFVTLEKYMSKRVDENFAEIETSHARLHKLFQLRSEFTLSQHDDAVEACMRMMDAYQTMTLAEQN